MAPHAEMVLSPEGLKDPLPPAPPNNFRDVNGYTTEQAISASNGESNGEMKSTLDTPIHASCNAPLQPKGVLDECIFNTTSSIPRAGEVARVLLLASWPVSVNLM